MSSLLFKPAAFKIKSHYKIQQSTLVSQLEAADSETEKKLHQEIQEELVIYGILSDALSIADRVLHAKAVRKELGDDNGVYKQNLQRFLVESATVLLVRV